MLKNFSNLLFFQLKVKSGLAEGLALKTVPALNGRTGDCASIETESEPVRLGHVNISFVTKKSFIALFLLLFVKKFC